MKLFRLGFSTLIFSTTALSAQIDSKLSGQTDGISNHPTKIMTVSDADSSFFKLQLVGARYDYSKNQLPFYQVSKTTNKNQNATASLLVKQIAVVPENQAGIIKKHFKSYLSNRFELVGAHNTCINEVVNIYKILTLYTLSQFVWWE